MDPLVLFAVLLAAFLHAAWNGTVRLGLDRRSTMLLLGLTQGGLALVLLPFVARPEVAAWGWILAGAALHAGYKLFLVRAYQGAELSQVYPLARGAAPAMVAAISAIWLGERLGSGQLAAVALICAGILAMALGRGRPRGATLAWALGTACFTAAYTLVDAQGARVAGTAAGYVLWMAVLDAGLLSLWSLATRGPAAFAALPAQWRPGLVAGALSLSAYWIAVWAFSVAPVALVAALRETSILFALAIGALAFKERVGRRRWLAAGTILAGVALVRLAA